ncbi:MAG: hypothetical protein M1819_003848 [Sarea resinae]|nr:MAG: hypothetical protein M1819_003848 [Sarea resinae]
MASAASSSAEAIAMAVKSSIGSNIFALSALLVISLTVLLLLRHYLPLRTTPAYLLVPIFLALALPASIVLLVPIDLASSSTETGDARGIWLPDRVMLVVWRLTYWLTFALTWVILPLLADYSDSGFRTPKDRFLYSLRVNARYQLIVLGCGTAGLVYVFIQSGVHFSSLKALIMALAYCWGLILAIYLMGHGLVALPRRLLRNASVSGRLRRLQIQAPKVYDRLNDSIEELDELEVQVMELRQRKDGTARNYQDWIEDLTDVSTLPESRASVAPRARVASSSVPAVLTERYLADLTRKLKRARHTRLRFIDTWDRLVQEATDTQAILDAAGSQRLDFGQTPSHAPFYERVTLLTPYTRYHLYANIIPAIRYFFGAFFSLASIAILWSEMIKFAKPNYSLISLTVVHHPNSSNGQIGFAGQCIAAVWLLYMCATALTSMSDVKVWGNRALVRRNTYGESACWYATQTAKLTVPLSYNFVTFMPFDVYHNTTFYHFLGRLIDLTPLGKGFDYFFPMLILIPVLATLFNLYGKVKRLFGFGVFDAVPEEDDQGNLTNPSGFGTGGWREGRDLIDRELHGASSGLGLASRTGSGASSPVGPGPHRTANTSLLPTVRNNPRGRTDPSLLVPSRDPRSSLDQRQSLRTQNRDGRRVVDDDDDEGFFQSFGHRVKNTFETTDKPRWLSNLQAPKWMSGDSNDDGGVGGGPSRAGGLGRWFGGSGGGGGASDGHVRL